MKPLGSKQISKTWTQPTPLDYNASLIKQTVEMST